jgi:hypothetical protein
MLAFLRGKASERQLRLLACAVGRLLWDRLAQDASRRAVEVAEQYADGLATVDQLKSAWTTACLVFDSSGGMEAAGVATNCAYSQAAEAATGTVTQAAVAGISNTAVAATLREILGNPFHPVSINAAWLAANDRAVERIAQGIYEEQAFNRMPVLADALEDAGCTEEQILGHCWGRGEHVRGCWVVDALLDKK